MTSRWGRSCLTSRLRTSPTTTMKRILEDQSQDTCDGFIVYMYGGNTQD